MSYIGNTNSRKAITYDVDINGCHICTSHSKTLDGYPVIYRNNKKYIMSRYIFELNNGYLPEEVMHTCDNPTCINPQHLVGGTHSDNMKDMANKNRSTKGKSNVNSQGESSYNAKLTEVDVKFIRYWLYKGYTQQAIADIFNVSRRLVGKIGSYKAWKHI